jgi:hypothetical protein
MRRFFSLVLAFTMVTSFVFGLSEASAETPQYAKIAGLKLSGRPVGCVDVAWAAGQRLIDAVEVRWLHDLGVQCPDATVSDEDVPSSQYVVMVALAARGELGCADVQWNAGYGFLTWTAAVNLSGLVGGCQLNPYAHMVTLLKSGWLTCRDVDWNVANGLITPDEEGWLRKASGCLLAVSGVDELLGKVAAAAPEWGVRLTGIAVENLRSGGRWAVNGDQQMSFMSSAKLPWAIMAAATVDTAEVERYAYPVFANSDNDAAGSLIDLAGGIDRVNRYWYPTLGMSGSCHQRWNAGAVREYSGVCGYPTNPVFDLANGHEFWNHNTPNDLTTVMGRLWRGEIPGLDAAARARLLEWSTWPVAAWAPDGDGTITGHLPAWTWPSVHHKVGWFFDPYQSASDVGIVDVAAATYAVAIAAYGGESTAAQADFMSWASCQIYRTLTGDTAWACPPRVFARPPGRLDLAVNWTPSGGATSPSPTSTSTTTTGGMTPTTDPAAAMRTPTTAPPTSSASPTAPVRTDIPSGQTRLYATTASSVDVQVTIGPRGLRGDHVIVSSTSPDCSRRLPITGSGASISYTCRISLTNGTPPVAQRWTAFTEGGASASAGAIFVANSVDGQAGLQVQSSPTNTANVQEQLDGRAREQ